MIWGGPKGQGGRRVSEGEPKGTEWRGRAEGSANEPRVQRRPGVGRGKVRDGPKAQGVLKKEAKASKTLILIAF